MNRKWTSLFSNRRSDSSRSLNTKTSKWECSSNARLTCPTLNALRWAYQSLWCPRALWICKSRKCRCLWLRSPQHLCSEKQKRWTSMATRYTWTRPEKRSPTISSFCTGWRRRRVNSKIICLITTATSPNERARRRLEITMKMLFLESGRSTAELSSRSLVRRSAQLPALDSQNLIISRAGPH